MRVPSSAGTQNPEISLEKGKEPQCLFVPLYSQHSYPPKKETAFIQQGELRSSHHLCPRAGVLNKIPRDAKSGQEKQQSLVCPCHMSPGTEQDLVPGPQ